MLLTRAVNQSGFDSHVFNGPFNNTVPLCFAADCHGDDAQAVLGLGLYGVPSFPSERKRDPSHQNIGDF
ncbi:hypothetical protein ROHU_032770 [Labeo rohita]|uniref:Uncharacterized protein n=1 Tax=Labeo rohita TaxID=84645 RepID=A0A498LHM9_LABRO|nr:hypothetical protein ROHU_032770 [Labeo rohita]